MQCKYCEKEVSKVVSDILGGYVVEPTAITYESMKDHEKDGLYHGECYVKMLEKKYDDSKRK